MQISSGLFPARRPVKLNSRMVCLISPKLLYGIPEVSTADEAGKAAKLPQVKTNAYSVNSASIPAPFEPSKRPPAVTVLHLCHGVLRFLGDSNHGDLVTAFALPAIDHTQVSLERRLQG